MFGRRTLLALIVVGVVPAFGLVNTLASAARAKREAISAGWARRGAIDLAAGHPGVAADDYQTANQYARDRGAYRLQLARALIAAGRRQEAAAELQTLWNAEPGNGMVNLELARLYASQDEAADAVRHYRLAVDGAYDTNAVGLRRQARLELARFLLAHGDRTQAQAELVALASDQPSNPTDPGAARLAGEVAFDTGDYRTARRYLDRAKSAGLDPDGVRMLDLSTRVIGLDPYTRGISSRERVRRVVRAYQIASAALDRCAADQLAALRSRRDDLDPRIDERALAGDPDAVDDALAFGAETMAAIDSAGCGGGPDDERALSLVFTQRRPPA